jgi:ATP-dependent helicase/nuclease subunit A
MSKNPYLEAREIRDHNVLVSASAGAGKTTNLIGRLLDRIQKDRISVTSIIAVTFAKDAAAELKEKLEEKLTKAYEETKDTFLYEQLSLLPQAQITTIHSFCLDLVRSYSYVLSKDPASTENIIDETKQSAMMDEAFDMAIQRFPEKRKADLDELLAHFSPKPESRSNLQTSVYSLASKLNTVNDPQSWIDQSIKHLEATDFSHFDDELKSWFETYYQWKVDNLISKAISNYDFLLSQKVYYDGLEGKGKTKVDVILKGLQDMIGALQSISSTKTFDYSSFRSKIVNLPKDCFNPIHDKGKNPLVSKPLEGFVEKYKELIGQLYDETEWFADHSELKSRTASLGELTVLFMSIYQSLKEKEKVIDFDDMEHFALQILRDKEFGVAEEYQRKYSDILVDEYQDTNAIQDTIINLIARNNNVFRVGDVKQSIYRFRNAQPELMAGRKNIIDDLNTVLYYDKNFRSAKSIVDFNNLLFKRLMNLKVLKARYDEVDAVSIGREEQKDNECEGVEFHLLVEPEVIEANVEQTNPIKENSESTVETGSESNLSEQTEETIQENIVELYPEDLKNMTPKAIYIANLIQDMRKNTKFKKYSDYTILVRSNGVKEKIKDIFDQANIPNSISVKSGFFSSDTVQDVLLMVNFIIEPRDSINFIGLCLSKFIQMSEDSIANLKIKKSREFTFFEALETVHPTKYNQLVAFRKQVEGKNLVEIFRAIYNFNNYYDDHCSKQQRANLDLLFEKAQTFSQDNISLSEFLELIKNIKNEESSEAIPYTKKDDVVKVMTIHQSKGLQFPVVIYWSADHGDTKDIKNDLLVDTDLGFVLKTVKLPKRLVRKSPVRIAIEMKAIQDDVEEQVRLLYVALTRAQNKLIIVDTKPKKTHPSLSYTSIMNTLGPTNWILLALKPNEAYKHIEVPSPTTLTQINPPVVEAQTLVITQKDESTIEFKTPSSKHTKFTHFKLNFDTNIGANHGNLIHELFEKLPHQGVTEAMIKQLQSDISDSDLDAVMSFYKDEIYTELSLGDIHHEYPFYALIENEVLLGYMDMVSFTDEATYLVDYKTDRVDSKETLLELYSDQLKDYAKVLKQMRPELPVRTYLYSLALKSFIPVI